MRTRMVNFALLVVVRGALAALLCACVWFGALGTSAAQAATVNEMVRMLGRGDYPLHGLGLVVGLPGTGDSGKDAALARPLAELLKNEGNAPANLKELQSMKGVALVMVTCTIPETGGRSDDKFDLEVSAVGSASSLKGGRLFLAPLRGPWKNSDVYALASGQIDIEDAATPTVGKVRRGAQLLKDVLPVSDIGATFDLVIDPAFSGWASAGVIADAINGKAQPQGPTVATVIDDRLIRVTIPPQERSNKAAFIADVLSADVNTTLMDLPAQVICNSKTGTIVVTGDVEISPGLITHKDLTITTTIPAPTPTAANPLVTRERYVPLATKPRASDNAKLQDLLAAFKQLDVAPAQQIEILQLLSKSGRLHAKLVND
jgi:flagellar P-ring protein precursor FlgI